MDNRLPDRRNPNGPPDGDGGFHLVHGDGEELLSAYLDGECTPAEVTEIEARLEASSELRQLAEEMRSIRATLGRLRQHRLDPNFAEQIVRRAEREVLTGRTEPPAGPSADTRVTALPEPLNQPATSSGGSSARPFLWSLAALAAAILILVTQQSPEIRRDPVARGPEAKVPAAVQADKESSGAPAKDDLAARAKVHALSSRDEKMHSAASEPAPDVDRDRVTASSLRDSFGAPLKKDLSDSATAKEAEGNDAEKPALAKDARELPADRKSLESESFIAGDGAKKELKSGEDDADKLSTRNRSFKETVTSGARSDTAASPNAPGLAPQNEPNAPVADAPTPKLEESPPASAATRGMEKLLSLDQKSGSSTLRQAAGAGFGAESGREGQSVPAVEGESLRVVEVLVSRDAWQQGAVEEVLAKNRIVVLDDNSQANDSQATNPSRTTKAPSPTAPEGPRGGEIAEGSSRNRRSESKTIDKSSDRLAAAEKDGLELLVVTATASQVNGAIDDFREQNRFQVLKSTEVSPPAARLRQSTLQQSAQEPSGNGVRFGKAQDPNSASGALGREVDDPIHSEQSRPQSGTKIADQTSPPAHTPADEKKVTDSLQDLGSPKKAEEFSRQATPTRRNVAPKPDEQRKPNETASRPAGRPAAAASEGFGPQPLNTEAGDRASGKPTRGLAKSELAGGSSDKGPAGETKSTYGSGFGGGFAGGLEGRLGGGSAGGARGGYGGIANGPTGGAQLGSALSAAEASPVPQGYGQRVTLERGDAKELGQGLAAGLAAPREPNARLNKSIADPNAESNGLAQQRVLFLFRIADAPAPATRPLAGAAGQSDAGAKSNEPAAVNAAPPVPAPANAGGSPK